MKTILILLFSIATTTIAAGQNNQIEDSFSTDILNATENFRELSNEEVNILLERTTRNDCESLKATKELIGPDLYEFDLPIPKKDIIVRSVTSICRYVRNPWGYIVCAGVVGVGSYLLLCATEGKNTQGEATLGGMTHYWSIFDHGDHIHFRIASTNSEDFAACPECK